MMPTNAITSPHLVALPLQEIAIEPFPTFRTELIGSIASGGRLSSFFGAVHGDQTRLFAIISHDESGTISVSSTLVGERYPALTPDCPQAHWFEREIAEQWGVVPEGHPWFKPIRFHRSYRAGKDAWNRPPNAPIDPCVNPPEHDYFRVEGAEIHEVAVGPVHAGIIEPGHFRFQCHGEHVYHLEIALGYQHRGIERALIGGPTKRSLPMSQQIAGDTSIGHGTAYCHVIEVLAGATPPLRAQMLRGICLELERLANHTGDLGALGDDVGFLPTAAYCGRIRGDFLNATALICGNRFGRSMVRPGGVRFDIDPTMADTLVSRLEPALDDVGSAGNLLWNTLSVQSRFETTGTVSHDDAAAVGLVGPAGRASGLNRDVRHDFPTGAYRFAYIPMSTESTGDVYARAFVRALEIRRSGRFLLEQLKAIPEGPLESPVGPLAPNSLAVGLVEGWRGEICHVAITDEAGRFAAYKIVDPSFHNWFGLSLALRNQQISDFPLCNKSFNLSYCGHDL
jgi:Ni,Fe-hydrogenase III large subunit